MNDAAFYEAATAQLSSRRILGFALKPFSAGHLILLHRLNSPFLSEAPADAGQLFAAAFICSQTFEDAVDSMLDPTLPEFERWWQRRLCGQTGWRARLGLKRGGTAIDVERESEAFREYMSDGWNHPDWIAGESDGREIGSPLIQTVKVTLMARIHLSETQFLNRAWSLSLWDYLTLKEMDEQVQLIDHAAIEAGQVEADAFDAMVRKGAFRN